MADESQILELVLATVRDEGDEMDYAELRDATPTTGLYGGDAGIDSLSLVRLITAIELAASKRFGQRVVLADEKALSQRNGPFRTVQTVATLLSERLAARSA